MKRMETIVPIGNIDTEAKAASNTTNTLMDVKQRHSNVIFAIISAMFQQVAKLDKKKAMHGIKVGLALAVVSLLFVIKPLYEQVGDNAMWAIMTVVVVFEFSSGATLSKGLNRGMGTIAGGGLGCLAAISAREIGHISRAIFIGISIFVVGAAATYTRLVPSVKIKYDYGVMIFILTFNLVAVSGIRADEVIRIGCDRLMTIIIGFALCILISLFLYPIWAGDELHHSISKKFEKLATAIEECIEDYFGSDGKTRAASNHLNDCISILYSKASDESLANFASWEPWHGKFGFSYPWNNYLKIGDSLRELAACIYSLKGLHLNSHYDHKKSQVLSLRMEIQEPCASLGSLLSFILVELGHNFSNMKRCDHPKQSTRARIKHLSDEVRLAIKSFLSSKVQIQDEMIENGMTISFVFGLLDVASKVERLEMELENLEILAGFRSGQTITQ